MNVPDEHVSPDAVDAAVEAFFVDMELTVRDAIRAALTAALPLLSVPEEVEVLAAHRWQGAWGDNDNPVTGKYFRCSCGWTHRVDGMNGWESWMARHDQHIAEQLTAARTPDDDAEGKS